MIDLINFISSAGKESVNFFWFPVTIWTLFALTLSAVLWKYESLPSPYQFHTRAALIAALPLGIAGSSALNWWSTFGETAVPAGIKLIVFQNPISVTPADPSAGAASIPWGDPYLWAGFLLVILTLGSVISVGYLFWNLYQLRFITKQLHFKPVKEVFDKSDFFTGDATTRLAFSSSVSVPFTYGCWQKRIVLPETLRNAPQELTLAIKHELIHIKHRDFFINSILSFIRCVFWFHPLAHRLHKECKEYREITCDSEVLSDKEVSRKKYAQLLYRLATQTNSTNQAMVSMAVNSSTLKKRIKMMNNQTNTINSYKRSLLIMTLSTFLIVGVMSCSDLQNDQNNKDEPSEVNAVPSEQSPEPSKSDDGDFFVAVEKMPELKGGLDALQKEVNYPERARKAGIEGRVIVQFVVNKEGKVEDPRVIRGIGGGADEEALRVVKQAEFVPGKQKGQPVSVQYSMPVTFRL